MNTDKMTEITRLYNEQASEPATSDELAETMNYDWNQFGHQEWLDTAPASEIASWLLSGVHTGDPEPVR